METLSHFSRQIRENIGSKYKEMFRESGGAFSHPFMTPGSAQYDDVLWDWDSWLSDVALRQILEDQGDDEARREALKYEQGCILNALGWCGMDGWIPPFVNRKDQVALLKPKDIYSQNMHKPVLAQHAAFLCQSAKTDAEWLRDAAYPLQAFINNYVNHHRHENGLYFWQNDYAIGVDNDPCTYFRPSRSSGSIYLNCLMYKELRAMAFLCRAMGLGEVAPQYERDADSLLVAVREHCWDDRDGFYYSVDLNLLPVDHQAWLHRGMPRSWSCLIQRLGVWSGFMSMWAGIATPDQAERIVREHYLNPETFHAPYGVRTLSRMEKMYSLKASGNPSSWLGPVWGVSNYMTFRGLVQYGYRQLAEDLAEKTIRLFGRDLERFGALHEYYQPENGEPILNKGFQNWNYLVLNMIDWLEGKPVIAEF